MAKDMTIETIVLTNGQEFIADVTSEENDQYVVRNTVQFIMGNFGEEMDSMRPFPWPTHADPVTDKVIPSSSVLYKTAPREDARKAYDQFIMGIIYNPQ